MAENALATVSNNPTGSIWAASFWKGASERAIKTGAQVILTVLTVDTVGSEVSNVDVFALDWFALLGVFLGGVFFSLVTSVANPQFVAGVHDIVRVPDPVPVVYEPKHRATDAALHADADGAAARAAVLRRGGV